MTANKSKGLHRVNEALLLSRASLLIFISLMLIQPIVAQVKPKADSLNKPIQYTPPKKVADSVIVQKHSPRKATIYSFICPGLGQIYNHKYWKLPLVYGGFGTMAYFYKANSTEFKKFRDAYNFVTENHFSASITKSTALGDAYTVVATTDNPKYTPVNDYVTRYNRNADLLKSGRDYYRRNLQLTYIVTGAWYVLVAIDAQVDAHFFDFDVSTDLTLNVKPFFQPPTFGTPGATGVSLCFSF